MSVVFKIKRRNSPLPGAEPAVPRSPARVSIIGTEDWAGEELAEWLQGIAYWLEAANKWIMWDGRKWNIEAGALLMAEAMKCARKVSADGAEAGIDAILKSIKSRHSARGAAAALTIARSRLIGDSIKWNPDPHLLNCWNGVIDLRTGELLKHDPKYMMTLVTPVSYLPGSLDAQCPSFRRTLRRFQPQAEVREYLHRQYGYRATGEVGERAFFCQVGEGSNGKSTIENMFARALGEYHADAAGGLFLQSLNATFAKDASGHTEALFAVRYKRNVLVKEPDNRHRLDESLIKQFTDGQNAVFRSRTLHKEGVDTPVTQKIVLYSNSPPLMSAARSITNRLHAVHWKVTIDKADEDPNFPSKFLVPELQGILCWIVEGAVKFYAQGAKLGRPAFLAEGEEEYRKGGDPLGDFVDRHILKGENEAGIPFALFYERYCTFCERARSKPRGVNVMGKALKSHGVDLVVLQKDTKHPVTPGKRLEKELRWLPKVTFVD